MDTQAEVERHYTSSDIAGRILAALREVHGADTPITLDALAPLDHFHGRGVVATEALAARLGPRSGERLLDIGCGIGGPARWMAVHFGCHVTGIDLTRAFCDAAAGLTAACGLTDQVRIVQGSATALPFPDGSFDHAWSQNALMNIADKPRFYREAFRVVRPGGMVAVDQIGAGPTGSPTYPQPWASVAETSFLTSAEQIRADITAAGFEIIELNDTTEAAIAFLEQARRRIRSEGPPRLGVHVVLGERFREVMTNSAEGLTQHRVSVIQCLLRRPA